MTSVAASPEWRIAAEGTALGTIALDHPGGRRVTEGVRACIGRLDHFARMVRLFGRPVPETRAETVWNSGDLQLCEQPRERHVGHRLASGGGEHQRVAFMRGAGTVHTAAARSTSAHRAPRTSPERAAVSTRNSNAKALAQPPRRRRLHLPDALHRLEHVGARHVAHGQLAEVREGKAPSAAP